MLGPHTHHHATNRPLKTDVWYDERTEMHTVQNYYSIQCL